MEPIKKITYKSHIINIYYDEIPIHPRQDRDNLGTIQGFNPEYALSDNGNNNIDIEDFFKDLAYQVNSELEDEIFDIEDGHIWKHRYENYGYKKACEMAENDIRQLIEETILANYVIFPICVNVQMEEIAIDETERIFNSKIDGVVYCSHDDMRAEYGNNSNESIEMAKECLKAEIKAFSDYYSGQVYGYDIETNTGEEVEISCWCFFGDYKDSGLIEDAKAAIDNEIDDNLRRITNNEN